MKGGIYLSVVLALAAMPVRAGTDTNRYAGDTWTFCDSQKVLAAAADITLAKYPNSDAATVEEKMVRVYRPTAPAKARTNPSPRC